MVLLLMTMKIMSVRVKLIMMLMMMMIGGCHGVVVVGIEDDDDFESELIIKMPLYDTDNCDVDSDKMEDYLSISFTLCS